MSRRLLIDTGVLIAIERGKLTVEHVFEEGDDIAVAAITVAELLVGVELADEKRRSARQAFVDDLLSTAPTETYGPGTAQAHARLLAHVKRVGKPRGAHDLIIAATAVATGRGVLTADSAAAWNDLPGVTAITIDT